MNAMTSTERSQRHRKLQAAIEFAELNQLGEAISVVEFLQAKADSMSPSYASVSLDAGFSNRVHDELQNYYHDWASDHIEIGNKDDWPVYSIKDMLEAWETVAQEFKQL